jgi:hypothetical protein
MEKEHEWPYLMSARVEASLQFQYGQASSVFTQHVYTCEDCNPVHGLCATGIELNTICLALENEILELGK